MVLHSRNQNKTAEQLHLKNSLEQEDQQSGHVLLVKFGSVTRLKSTFLLFDNKYIRYISSNLGRLMNILNNE